MIEITTEHIEAIEFASAVYELFAGSGQHNSSSPLTKSLGVVEPDNLASWNDGAGLPENISDRHFCGFFIYITLTASADERAFGQLYFDTAFSHVNCKKYSRPDKAIISTSLMANHISFDASGVRPLFRLTEIGRKSYVNWIHLAMLHDFPALMKFAV